MFYNCSTNKNFRLPHSFYLQCDSLNMRHIWRPLESRNFFKFLLFQSMLDRSIKVEFKVRAAYLQLYLLKHFKFKFNVTYLFKNSSPECQSKLAGQNTCYCLIKICLFYPSWSDDKDCDVKTWTSSSTPRIFFGSFFSLPFISTSLEILLV